MIKQAGYLPLVLFKMRASFTQRLPVAKIAKVVDEFTKSGQSTSLSDRTIVFENVELLLKLDGVPTSIPKLSLYFEHEGVQISAPGVEVPSILRWEAMRRIALSRRRFYRSSQVYHLVEISTHTRSYSFAILEDQLVRNLNHLASLAGSHGVEVVGTISVLGSEHRYGAFPSLQRRVSSTLLTMPIVFYGAISRFTEQVVRQIGYLVGASPRHGLAPRQRLLSIGVALLALVLIASSTAELQKATVRPVAKQRTVDYPRRPFSLSAVHLVGVTRHPPLEPIHPINLPPATVTPAPLPPSLAKSQALSPHEIFGFAPYWTLQDSSGFDLNAITTIAYFGVDVAGNGGLIKAGSGWNGYESADLASLITRAHEAGVRVVLTVKSFSQTTLDQLTHDPGSATTLAISLEKAITAKEMDGVNFDLEGQGSADRAGLVKLIAKVSTLLREIDPYWQITMDTYGSSAMDAKGFFDIKALAPYVNAFFVMAYDMGSMSTPSPTAPLSGYGYSDLSVIEGYLGEVPPSKVILGVPFYGYEWPTDGGYLGASTTGAPTPLTYAQIASSSWPVYWDSFSSTPWTSFQVAGQWYEVYYDDPTSLSLKADLSNFFSLRGVGVWALGMDGNDPAMLAALLGQATPLKDLHVEEPPPEVLAGSGGAGSGGGAAGATSSAPSTPKPPAYWYKADFNGNKVQLVPATLQSVLANGSWGVLRYAGRLSSFSTNDPHYACLSTSPALDVWKDTYSQEIYVVDNESQPDQCAVGIWKVMPEGSVPLGEPPSQSVPSSGSVPTSNLPF